MSATLATPVDQVVSFCEPADFEKFFRVEEVQRIRTNFYVPREQIPIGQPGESCKTNLFFGFFLDGTRNNMRSSLENQNHTETNIARLYSAFPGQSVPNILPAETEWAYKKDTFKNYFRVYTPGVGTPFDEVRDTGVGIDRVRGNAAGALGERRIIWTLVQAINNIHRFFTGVSLVDPGATLALCRALTLNATELRAMNGAGLSRLAADSPGMCPSVQFKALLTRLHSALQLHMPGPNGAKPQRTDPGLVQQIFVSVFGFSRGAAQARAFSRWLVALCKMDAQLLGKSSMTLAGFPVTFDFLGLFDTVASVGLANTMGLFKGHSAWADSEYSLRIPEEVAQCKHFVSANEVRRSFPLDSAAVNQSYADNCQEIVYPGVHSDLGGGYMPQEQGKGLDPLGGDMLSRIPLAHMYHAARLAGVPLKLELASPTVKQYFKVAPATVEAFNRFLGAAKVTKGSVTDIMREQRKLYILWRKARRGAALEAAANFGRARAVDQNDMRSANVEFETEINDFEIWCKKKYSNRDGHRAEPGAPQLPGFHNSRDEEWEEVAGYWHTESVTQVVAEFFDNFVHDSRAWFKITGTEADDVVAELQSWAARLDDYEQQKAAGFPDGERGMPLSNEQLQWVLRFKATGKVPVMQTGGREPLMMAQAGYLRYRKIYAGGDKLLISGSQPQEGPDYVMQLRDAPVPVATTPLRRAAA